MMETSSEPQANPYLSGPIAPLFFKTAAPIVLLMLVSGLFTVVDAIFLGVYVGPRALAAVTLVFPLFMAHPDLMPARWQKAVAQAADDTTLARLVCDYIAGMTDRFALQEHQRLIRGAAA